MSLTPRLDIVENATEGLGIALKSSVVNLTYLTPVNGVPGAGQFRSAITNRASMVNLSSDLLPRMGVERIMVQQITRVYGEAGPNNEFVFKTPNDIFDQIRFYGDWSPLTDNVGSRAQTPVTGAGTASVEVVFYGTGINILSLTDSNTRRFEYSVDGGAFTDVDYVTSGSAVLVGRNTAPNILLKAATGLALGIHTVVFRYKSGATSSGLIYGFEILNESSSIKTTPGSSSVNGQLLTLPSLDTQAYNSGFESGVLGTRGGRVLVYQKSDGTIGKAVTPTDAASAFMTSANHTNEEIVRTHFFREFGAGRADDFSTLLASSSNRAFTLEDGTTSLTGNAMLGYQPGVIGTYAGESCVFNSVGSFLTLTFVGTGIDYIYTVGNSGTSSGIEHLVDGTSLGTVSITSANFNETKVRKVASGLPYGTHTMTINIPGGYNINYGVIGFHVYGPKKPALPSGAIELGEYNIVANPVVQGTTSLYKVSTGVIRKSCMREMIYGGGSWSTFLNTTLFVDGFDVETLSNGAYVEFTFFGTGFDMIYTAQSGNSTSVLVQLDGVNLGSTGSPTTYGGTSGYNTGTSLLNTTSGSQHPGSGLFVSGLTLGRHTVRFTNQTTNRFEISAIDVITPIHVQKRNGSHILQNTLSIGSQGIGDNRGLGSQLVIPANSSFARGIASSPTNSGAFAIIPDMSVSHYSKTGLIQINGTCRLSNNSSGQTLEFTLYVDGMIVPESRVAEIQSGTGENLQLSETQIIYVGVGWHTIYMTSNRNGGATDTFLGAQRVLSVIDI